MAESFKNSKHKKLLALCLSLMMASSAIATLAACGSSSSSSSDSSDTETESTETVDKDPGVSPILNASFQYNSKKATNLIITDTSGWSKTTSGQTSKAKSGIIDVSDEKWNNLTKSKIDKDPAELTVAEAKANWSKMSAYDKLKFAEAYEDETDEDFDELEFYDADTDAFNISAVDIPLFSNLGYNPGTPDQVGSENYDPYVLMIHNQYTDNRGTAQKFTSSSTITLQPNTYAKLSVWVKTKDLETSAYGEAQPAVDVGAYIGVNQTVGGKTLDQMQVKNINTNDWTQYTFWLEGSAFAESTFTLTLGLGQGTVTSDIFEHVNGYAFFDDVECEIFTNKTQIPSIGADEWTYFDDEAEDKLFDAKNGKKAFGVSVNSETANCWSEGAFHTAQLNIGVTEEDGYVAANPTGTQQPYRQENFDTTNDIASSFSNFAAIKDAPLKDGANKVYRDKVYANYFKDKTLFSDKPTILLMSADGATYTAKMTGFTLGAGKKMAISFFVKTADMEGFTGAGAKLLDKDGETLAELTSIDTTTIAAVDINDENKDIYDGWQECVFYIENKSDDQKEFSLSLTFGLTTVKATNKKDYHSGFAAFTNFRSISLTDGEYECASAGTYAKTVSFADDEEETSTDRFDESAYIPTNEIERNIANAKNYLGVVGNSGYVFKDGKDNTVNSNANAGLINKEYIKNYIEEAKADTSGDYWLNKTGLYDPAKSDEENATAIEEKLFGKTQGLQIAATQPLYIYNEKANASYGFIGSQTQTLAANSPTAVSVRVRVSEGAVATVYLVDMSESDDKSVMSIARRASFWYDDNGNVCEKDPKENKKKSNIAFKLQSNGLYKVNAEWSGAQELITANGKDAYYANLSAYAKQDEEQNLLVEKGGVSYDYNAKWINDGNDGVAFYFNKADGAYYATSRLKKADKVNQLPLSIARYQAESAKELKVEIKGDATSASVWQTITFYVQTGENAKNYRLEVWSGNREGTATVAANSYVLFDSDNPGTFESFDDLIADREDSATELVKDGYSFYDSPKFLRYDETQDDNGVGNSYKNYTTGAYNKEGVAYLSYSKGGEHEVYVNYSLSETTIPTDTETDKEETPEEETTTATGANTFLLISSLAVAGVLVLAVVSLIVRKVILKKRGHTIRVKREKKPAPKKEKPVKAKKVKTEEPKSENDPYND